MTAPVSAIQPFNFGPPERRVFGIWHPAGFGASAQPGVLLCNAFGQEAVRAHRMMRVLAERLARAGHPVLRFDYHGTGDSMGDDLDGDLDGWAADVHAADRELRSRSGAQSTVWIGMRLGAAVALRAAQQAPEPLARLLLWDPVLDGARYLRHLRQRHVASLEEAFSLMPVPSPAELARDPTRFCDEAIGFALAPRLREQLAGLRPSGHRWPTRPRSIVVIGEPDGDDAADLSAACKREPARVQTVAVRHGIDWTTDEAGDNALVPAAALMQLMEQAGAPL